MARSLSAAVFALPLLVVAPYPRQAATTPAAGTVPIYVSVFDRDGQPVRGLTQGDFEVYDNGVLQTITSFAGPARPPAVVLMLDASGSMSQHTDLVLGAGRRFLSALPQGARARATVFGQSAVWSPALGQPFAGRPDTVLSGLPAAMDLGTGTGLWDAVRLAMTELERESPPRVIVLCTDGDDTRSEKPDPRDVLLRARDEHHLVHALVYRSRYPAGRSMAVVTPDRALRQIASNTGGGYVELNRTEELVTAFERVAADLGHQYELGFLSQAPDGKPHRLEVKVKTAGATVRARREYVAGPRRPSPPGA